MINYPITYYKPRGASPLAAAAVFEGMYRRMEGGGWEGLWSRKWVKEEVGEARERRMVERSSMRVVTMTSGDKKNAQVKDPWAQKCHH